MTRPERAVVAPAQERVAAQMGERVERRAGRVAPALRVASAKAVAELPGLQAELPGPQAELPGASREWAR
jgi:hypothetical protein